MSIPSPVGDPQEHDVVFVSYSRDDEEWMRLFRKMLQPALTAMNLQLWTDSDLRTGEDWDGEIDRAMARSRTALLLVSRHFLASEYIQRRELPALIRRGVRLAPILVGACLYPNVPELRSVQWLHDPKRDGPLGAIEHIGRRDEQVERACTRLLATVVADPGYIARQIARVGVHACETDLRNVADDPAVEWWRRWVPRHAGVLTPPEGATAAASVAQTMQVWLAAEDATLPHGADPARLTDLIPGPHLALRWGLAPPAAALRRVLAGHAEGISGISWSPVGPRLAVGSSLPGEVRLRDTDTGDSSVIFRTDGRVDDVAWAPDGTRLAISTWTDGTGAVVHVWHTGSHRSAVLATYPDGGGRFVAWSPDSKYLATGGPDKIRIHDLASGRRTEFALEDGDLCGLAWSSDGTRIATSYGRPVGYLSTLGVVVYDAATGESVGRLTGLSRGARSAVWPTGSPALAVATTGRVRSGQDTQELLLWEPGPDRRRHLGMLTGDEFDRVDTRYGGLRLVPAPDGRQLVATGSYGDLRIWDIRDGSCRYLATDHTERVRHLAWSPAGDVLATTADGDHGECAVRLWDATTADTIGPRARERVTTMAWSPDGADLVAAVVDATGSSRELVIRSADTGQQSAVLARVGVVTAMAWSGDGTRLAVFAWDDGTCRIRIWDSADWREQPSLVVSNHFQALAWAPGHERLAVMDAWGIESCVRVWDLASLTSEELSIGKGQNRRLAWSPSGTLAVAGLSGAVQLWRSSAEPTTDLSTTGSACAALHWAPDGSHLAVLTYERHWSGTELVHVTNLATAATWGPPERVLAVAWSPDSRHLIVATHTHEIVVYDVVTHHAVTPRLRLTGAVEQIEWRAAGIVLNGAAGLFSLAFVE